MLSLHFARIKVRPCRPAPAWRCVIILLTLIAGLQAPAYAIDGTLTLADAQRYAVERSRQLAAEDNAVAASREMAVAASRLPDPVLKAGIDNLPVNGQDRGSLTNDFMTMRRIGVMQEWTSADKRQLRAERYAREADKTLAEKIKTTSDIERDTALAWLDLYYAQAASAIVKEQGEQAKLALQAAEGAYRAGRGSQADVFAAQSAVATSEDRASETQRHVKNAKTMLARWVGDAAELPLGSKPPIDAIRLDPASLDKQLAHHPEIAVLAKQEDIARTEVQLAEANKTPDWSIEIAYQQRGPSYSNMVSVGVSIPLQWNRKNRQDREVAAKLAMLGQAEAEREEMLRQHVAETRQMINEWDNDRERLVRYSRELIPLANQRMMAVIAAYRGGKAALSDVLDARRNEIDVRLQALQLEADTARRWAQLNFLTPTNDNHIQAAKDSP